MTPEDPDDLEKLETSRGQGTGGTGHDRLPGEEPPGSIQGDPDDDTELPPEATGG